MSNSLKLPEVLGKLPDVKKKVFPNGQHGNLATVHAMRQLAREYSGHPMVRQFAINILNYYGTKSHNHLDEARAIADYVKLKVSYVKDPDGIEYLTEPTLMIQKIQEGTARGDCDDMALLVATLLLSIGIQPFFCIVRYRDNNGPFNHIYVCVYEVNYRDNKKTRLVLDAIVKDKEIGHEVAHKSRKEFQA